MEFRLRTASARDALNQNGQGPDSFAGIGTTRGAAGGQEPPRPAPALPALRSLPGLAPAAPDVLTAIEAVMVPSLILEGDALVTEGGGGDTLYLVAEGRFEVFRAVPPPGTLRLATLRAGALVGTGALWHDRPRNASCVAARDSWVYGLDRRAFQELRGVPGRALREALLCALRTQLRSVGDRLAKIDALRATHAGERDRPLDELLAETGGALPFHYQAEPSLRPMALATLPFRDEVEPHDPGKRRLLEYIRGSIVGADEAIETPFGLRRVTYADYTADLRYDTGKLEHPSRHTRLPEEALHGQLAAALRIFESAEDGKRPRAPAAVSPSVMARSVEYERLRWFELPA